uniref:Zinc finger, CCHC-type, retrotransposon Gag domain protein n=1 Tax=Tanacetum cinerariifolium TaxID=118510 RepID=A0A6L2JGM9_TANCI|nr:zinc finger, CCHC-type, retrotransposon Gag domain protein [Tanacetum cinerariifolium]
MRLTIIKDLELMKVEVVVHSLEGYIASLKIEPNLILRIKEAQKEDGVLWSVLENLKEGKQAKFRVDDNEGLELIAVTNEKVSIAKENLKEARSRQKSYADRRALKFKPGIMCFLRYLRVGAFDVLV